MKPAQQTSQQPTHPSSAQGVGASLPRCTHRTPTGRRCRAEVFDSRATFCRQHLFASAHRYSDPELAAELLGPLTDFNSASDVTDFLSRLLILQAKDRIAPRRAAVMAYTCNLLLRGLRAIDLESLAAQKADDQAAQQII